MKLLKKGCELLAFLIFIEYANENSVLILGSLSSFLPNLIHFSPFSEINDLPGCWLSSGFHAVLEVQLT